MRNELVELCVTTVKNDVQEALDNNFGRLKETFFDEIFSSSSDEDPDMYDVVFSKNPVKDGITSEMHFNRAHSYVETPLKPTEEEIVEINNQTPKGVKYLDYAEGNICLQVNTFKGIKAYLVKKPGYKGPVHAEPTVIDTALPEGYKVMKLVTDDEVKTEGRLLSHCVGRRDMGYLSKLQSGEIELLSIRDPKGEPLFTVEKKGNVISQVKGSKNRLPGFGHGASKVTKPKEIEIVATWLKSKGIEPSTVSDLKPGLSSTIS
jgi:hypothetical protein